MELFLLPLFAVAMLILPIVYTVKKRKSPQAAKKTFIFNLCAFFGVLVLSVILPVGGFISADAAQTVEDAVTSNSAAFGYLAAAISTGLGSIGCGIAVASAAPAAIGAVAEEPKTFSKALIFVALGEGVALYGFLIAFLILNKL